MAAEHPDLRSERDRTPSPYRKPTIGNGEIRNVYRRADGTERYGCRWRDREAAELGRETLPGETFVEARDTRLEEIDASAMALPVAPEPLQVVQAVQERRQPSPTDRIALASEARVKGYTGEFCPQCQSPNTRRNGSCLVCDACGSTTGCS